MVNRYRRTCTETYTIHQTVIREGGRRRAVEPFEGGKNILVDFVFKEILHREEDRKVLTQLVDTFETQIISGGRSHREKVNPIKNESKKKLHTKWMTQRTPVSDGLY